MKLSDKNSRPPHLEPRLIQSRDSFRAATVRERFFGHHFLKGRFT